MFFRIQKILQKATAFSLVELMIVCIIIGVLASISVPALMTARLRAEEEKATVTLYAFAQAQKAYWFDHAGTAADPNTYANGNGLLVPSYINVLLNDGDWIYNVTAGDATTFLVVASHLNNAGAVDGVISLSINEEGDIGRVNFPYTILEQP